MRVTIDLDALATNDDAAAFCLWLDMVLREEGYTSTISWQPNS